MGHRLDRFTATTCPYLSGGSQQRFNASRIDGAITLARLSSLFFLKYPLFISLYPVVLLRLRVLSLIMESWGLFPWVQLAYWKDWCVQALQGFERCFAFQDRGPQSWNDLQLSWTAQRILLLETADDHFLAMPTTVISFAFKRSRSRRSI